MSAMLLFSKPPDKAAINEVGAGRSTTTPSSEMASTDFESTFLMLLPEAEVMPTTVTSTRKNEMMIVIQRAVREPKKLIINLFI